MRHNSGGVAGSDGSVRVAKNGDARSKGARAAISGGAGLRDYPGAKGGAGVPQTIINQIPPHVLYVEAFVGSGKIRQWLKPSPATVVIDADASVIDHWKSVAGVVAIHGDARDHLPRLNLTSTDFVYADPPYLRSVRSCQRDYYEHEFATEAEHLSLIAVLKSLPCPVMISGYPSPLYSVALDGWRAVEFQTVDRRGNRKTECIWMNYGQPVALHDYRYLGRDKRERERIKRKRQRWETRLRSMPVLERQVIWQACCSVAGNGGVISSPEMAAGDLKIQLTGCAAVSGDSGRDAVLPGVRTADDFNNFAVIES